MGLVKTRRLAAMQKQQRTKAGMKQRLILKNENPRKRRESKMKAKACVFFLAATGALLLRAVEFTVNQMPMSPFADTEVSTNMVINKSDINYADLKFRFDGTPTNNLELAFGTDVNTNGVLDAEEVDTRFGWRGGRYFIENARTWERFDSDSVVGSRSLSVELHIDIRTSPQQVRRITVAGANASAFGELVSGAPPAWLWRREWNLMRATRRGTEPPSDWLSYKAANLGFSIRLR